MWRNVYCDVAAGRLVTPPAPISALSATAEHADQARNLFVVRSRDDLRPLLDAPMATWIAFLHPTQRKLAYGTFNGAVKVTGSAGTAKRSWPCTGPGIWPSRVSVCC